MCEEHSKVDIYLTIAHDGKSTVVYITCLSPPPTPPPTPGSRRGIKPAHCNTPSWSPLQFAVFLVGKAIGDQVLRFWRLVLFVVV